MYALVCTACGKRFSDSLGLQSTWHQQILEGTGCYTLRRQQAELVLVQAKGKMLHLLFSTLRDHCKQAHRIIYEKLHVYEKYGLPPHILPFHYLFFIFMINMRQGDQGRGHTPAALLYDPDLNMKLVHILQIY